MEWVLILGSTGWTGFLLPWAVPEGRRCWSEPGCAQQLQVLSVLWHCPSPWSSAGTEVGLGPAASLLFSHLFLSFSVLKEHMVGAEGARQSSFVSLVPSSALSGEIQKSVLTRGYFLLCGCLLTHFKGFLSYLHPLGSCLQETFVCRDGKVKGEQVWTGKEAKQAL